MLVASPQHVGDRPHQLVDLLLADDERRRERDDVAGRADQHVLLEALQEHLERARAGLACDRLELDARDHAEVAHVRDVRQLAQRVHRVLEVGRELARALEELLFLERVEARERRGARERMARVGVAVEELDRILRRGVHDRVVDALAHDDRAHRHRAVGEPFREAHHVRDDAEEARRERRAEPAEARDHFVEDEQDAVLVADRAQPLEIAFRRNQHAGRSRHRLDDDRGDVRRVVQRDDARLELVGEMRAPRRLAARERVLLEVVRVRQVIDVRQQVAERLAVVRDAADRDAAEVRAVVAALAPDQPAPRRLAARAVIGERDLERGVDRLRSPSW